jgi:hypothetical protein
VRGIELSAQALEAQISTENFRFVGLYQSLTAAVTISNTRLSPSSPPMLPSLNGVLGIGRQLSREASLLNGWGKPVSAGSYCELLPPNL